MIILLLCFKHFGCLQLYFEVLYHGHVIWLQLTSDLILYQHLSCSPHRSHSSLLCVPPNHQAGSCLRASALTVPLPEHSSLRSIYSLYTIYIQISASAYRPKVSSPYQTGEYYLLPSLTPENLYLMTLSFNFIII